MLLYLNGAFVGLLILSNILAVKLFSINEWMDCVACGCHRLRFHIPDNRYDS